MAAARALALVAAAALLVLHTNTMAARASHAISAPIRTRVPERTGQEAGLRGATAPVLVASGVDCGCQQGEKEKQGKWTKHVFFEEREAF